jgi:hypothetical protein
MKKRREFFKKCFEEGFLKKWAVVQILIILFFIPNPFFRIYSRYQPSESDIKIVDIRHPNQAALGIHPIVLPYTFFTFNVGFSIGPSTGELHTIEKVSQLKGYIPILSAIVFLFLYLFIFGIYKLKFSKNVFYLLVLNIFIPLIMALSFSIILEIRYHVRYVSDALPACLIVLSMGLEGKRKILFLFCLVGILLFSLSNFYFQDKYRKEDIRSAASFLEKKTSKNHAILLVGSRRAFEYYFNGEGSIVTFSRDEVKDSKKLSDKLNKINTYFNHVWIVSASPWRVDPDDTIATYYKKRYKNEDQKFYNGVNLTLYNLS